MKRYSWVVKVALVLVACSVLAYVCHYLFFRDAHHIFIYLVGDIAFVPIEVLLVAIVIEGALARHEKEGMLQKMNMPIGTFFSELGADLLGRLTECIENKDELRARLAIRADWSAQDYRRALAFARSFTYRVDMARADLPALRDLVGSHRDLLLMLLANPNLLEHERFTDLLWAVFHLMGELVARESLDGLPASDLEHLAGDVRRVYSRLTRAWLRYCEHLQTSYPYIFSILLRTHPLQDKPDPVVC
jgi:hypothetical protein